MATKQPSNRLTIPKKEDPPHPSNLQQVERWANSQVVNQIVAGTNVTITTQALSTGTGSTGRGIVTISATGGGGSRYVSLTGAGETVTPGALAQEGPFTVFDSPVMAGSGITFTTAGTLVASVDRGVSIKNTASGIATTSTVIEDDGYGIQLIALGSAPGHGNIDFNVAGGGIVQVCTSPLERLRFFNSGFGPAQQTVTGLRSSITDPNAQAVITSLLDALAAYGLIIDATT